MTRQSRKYATAVRVLLDPATGQVMGWAYLWDNGEESRIRATGLPAERRMLAKPGKHAPDGLRSPMTVAKGTAAG